ncbi:MAG: hypothetical protein IBX63_06495 [Coriobacteriia bacterium]|nr:hypothetical protein [Coriobacteriia bacterium]
MAEDQFIRFLAAWALVHETADEGWKAAVARGAGQETGSMGAGPEAFVDGLSAMVAEEKERLKASLAAGEVEPAGSKAGLESKLDDLLFEVGELRGRLESMQTTLDAVLAEAAESGEK